MPNIPVTSLSDLQAAINSANSGDTIVFAAGIYDLSTALNISKNLNFAGVPGAVLQGGTGILFSIGGSAQVSFDGFTFTGQQLGYVSGTAGQSLSITNSILNIDVDEAQDNVLHVAGPAAFTFENNTVDVTGYTQFMQLFGTGTISVKDNTFTGHAGTYNPGDDNTVPLILNLSGVDGEVSGNTFDGVDIGILVANATGPMLISDNDFLNLSRAPELDTGYAAGIAFFSPAPFDGEIRISGNTFADSDTGIRASAIPGSTLATSNIVVTGNIFDGLIDPTRVPSPTVGGSINPINSKYVVYTDDQRATALAEANNDDIVHVVGSNVDSIDETYVGRTNAPDWYTGTDGDDTFIGGNGGPDRYLFAATNADDLIAINRAGSTLSFVTATEGEDTIVGVEAIEFADGEVFDVQGSNIVVNVIDDDNSVIENTSPVATGNILGNDRNIDDALSTVTVATHGTYTGTGGYGSLVIGSDGAYTYTANSNAESIGDGVQKSDIFTFIVTDTGANANSTTTRVQTLTITITGTNDGPTVSAGVDDVSKAEDTAFSFTIPADAFNDVDLGDVLTYSATLADGSPLPSWITLVGTTFSGTPPLDFNGIISVKVTASDGVASVDDTFNLTITPFNDAPVAQDASASATEDGAVVNGNVIANDVDSTGLEYALTGAAVDGLTFTDDGSYSFDPAGYDFLKEGEKLVITRDYTVTDAGGETDTGTLTITVTGTNDVPVVNVSGIAADEGDAIIEIDALAGIADADGDQLIVTPVGTLPAGVTFIGDSLTIDFESGYNTGVSVVGQNDWIDGSPGTPFEQVVDDGSGTNTVLQIANKISYPDFGGPYTPAVSVTAGESVSGADVNQMVYSFRFKPVAGTPDGSRIELDIGNAEGTDRFNFMVIEYMNGVLQVKQQSPALGGTFVPTTLATLADFGSYHDIRAVVTFGDGANDDTIDYYIDGKWAGQGSTFENYTDIVPGNTHNDVHDVSRLFFRAGVGNANADGFYIDDISIATANGEGGPHFTFDPNDPAYDYLAAGDTLPVEITYEVSDGVSPPVLVTKTITVTGTNDNATISGVADGSLSEDTTTSVGGVLTAHDLDQGEAQFQIPANLDGSYGAFSFDADGTWSYTLDTSLVQKLSANAWATDSLVVLSKDGTATETIVVTITGTNDVPTVSAGVDDVSKAEDTAFSFTIPAYAFAEVDLGDVLTYSATLADGSPLPSWITLVGTTFSGTPPLDFNGLLSIKVTASDGLASAEDTFDFTITPVNDAPVAQDGTASATEGDVAPVTGSVVAIDVDSINLDYVLGGAPVAGLTFNDDGSYSFNATDAAYNDLKAGEELVITRDYTVTDAGGETDTGTLTITVTGTNDAPVVNVGDIEADEGDAVIEIDALAGISDADGDPLYVVQPTSLPAGVTFIGDSLSIDFEDYTQGVSVVGQNGWVDGSIGTPFDQVVDDGTGNTALLIANKVSYGDFEGPYTPGLSVTAGESISGADVSQMVYSFRFKPVDPSGIDGSRIELDIGSAENNDRFSFMVLDYSTGSLRVLEASPDATDGFPASYPVLADNLDPSIYHTLQAVVSFGEGEDNDTINFYIDGIWVGQGKTFENYSDDANGNHNSVYDVNRLFFRAAIGNADASGFYIDDISIATANAQGGPHFTFDPNDPAYDYLAAGDTLPVEITYEVSDGVSPPVLVTKTITVTGTNDNATISGDAAESLTEDTTTSVGGQLTASDVDDGEDQFQIPSDLDGTYGAFTFDADGTWTYTLDTSLVQNLSATASTTDSLVVLSKDGTANETIVVTITGTNDTATITDYVARTTNEDLTAPVGGKLTANDVDTGEAQFKTPVPASLMGMYGTFSFATDGTWSYVRTANLQYLTSSNSVTDTLTVTTEDGTDTQDIVVTINGLNDDATITTYVPQTITEDDTAPVGGKLTANDVDAGQDKFQVPASLVGLYGNFTFVADGTWTYTRTANLQYLGDDDADLTDSLTVSTADGSATQTITVTIEGRNEAPTVVGPNIMGGQFADTITGTADDDFAYGGGGNDIINAGDGDDNLYGQAGNDTIDAGTGDDKVDGGVGNDTVHGGSGDDKVLGGSGNDTLYGEDDDDYLEGGSGNDTLYGGAGLDTLVGGSGSDRLVGGQGRDSLTGNGGGDFFQFDSLLDSPVGAARDTITDFEADDKIDLTNFDTNTGTAIVDQFQFIGEGTADRNVADGQLKFYHLNGFTWVVGNAGSGTGKANFEIKLNGQFDLTADDFLGVTDYDPTTGDAGANILQSLAGRDTLTGNGGSDIFVFDTIADTPYGNNNWDQIADWADDDKLDLQGLYSGTLSFVGIGASNRAIATPGGAITAFGVETYYSGTSTFVTGDTTGDGLADFRIELLNGNFTSTIGVDNLLL